MLITIDTGLATCGIAAFDWPGSGELLDADVFTSSAQKRPNDFSGAWEALDTARRGRELSRWLTEFRQRYRKPHVIVAEAVVTARQARSLALQQHASGAVNMLSVFWGRLEWETPLGWRAKLGWFPTNTRGMSKRERGRAKKADDERLYRMLRTLRNADRLERLVLTHGRKRGQVVHAWDAYGLGRSITGVTA